MITCGIFTFLMCWFIICVNFFCSIHMNTNIKEENRNEGVVVIYHALFSSPGLRHPNTIN